jgi:hypothetical protein
VTGTNCDLFTHNQSRSYLNHLVFMCIYEEFQFFIFISYVFHNVFGNSLQEVVSF